MTTQQRFSIHDPVYCSKCGQQAASTHYNMYPGSTLCRDCRIEAATARLVPCIVCNEPADPESVLDVYRHTDQTCWPLHYTCLHKADRTAPLHNIASRRWEPKTWRTAELWYVLDCGWSYRAENKAKKAIHCTVHGREAMIELAIKQGYKPLPAKGK